MSSRLLQVNKTKQNTEENRIVFLLFNRMGTMMCKDSNEDEWIYVIRTGSCRVIKALTQVTPKLKTRKKAEVIYDHFGTKRISQYSMEALGTFKVESCK